MEIAYSQPLNGTNITFVPLLFDTYFPAFRAIEVFKDLSNKEVGIFKKKTEGEGFRPV